MATIDDIRLAFQNILQRSGTEVSDAEINSYVSAVNSGALTLAQARAALINSPEGQDVQDVVRLYQTVFGRVPDQKGLNDQVDTLRGPATEADLANSFANSPEFITRFGGNTVNTAFINAVYQQVLGRTPSADEVTFYQNSGFSAGRIALAFSESPEFRNSVNTAVVNFLDAAGQGTAVYTGPLGGSVNVGTTFTLSANVDAPGAIAPAVNTLGTAANDTYNAVNGSISTLTAADQINGGAGTDTLNLLLDANGSVAPLTGVTNVEIFNLRDTADGTTVDFSAVVGETQVWNDRGTGGLTATNLATGTTAGVRGDNNVSVGATVFSMATKTDAVSIAIDGGVKGGANITNDVNVTAGTTETAGPASATIVSSGVANTVGTIALSQDTDGTGNASLDAATVTAATLTANANLTATGITGFKADATLTINGTAASVALGTLAANVDVVNASAFAGGVTLVLDAEADTKFTGGNGNDIVTTGAVLTTGSVNAGAGTADRLVVADTTHLATAALGAKYTGFEQLQVNNGVSVNLDNIAGITSIRINDGAGATGVTNLTAAQAAAVTVVAGNATGAITIGVKGAETVGQIDTVKITADDGAATTSTIALGTPVLAGVERLEINAVDNVTVTALTSAEAVGTLVLTGAGTQLITSGAITPEANGVVDGSAATGALTIDFGGVVGAATTSATSFIGGSKGDTITTTGGAADLVNGKGGLDTLVITKDGASSGFATVQSEAITTADADIVVGFVTGENKFDFNGALANGTGTSSNGIQAGEIVTATTFATGLAAGGAANAIVFQATTDLTGAQETALDTLVAGAAGSGFNQANVDAVKAAFLATGGALNGVIANLDSVVGAGDSVLVQFETDTDTVVFRLTNSDTTVANTLTADEVQLVGVFDSTASVAAGDYV